MNPRISLLLLLLPVLFTLPGIVISTGANGVPNERTCSLGQSSRSHRELRSEETRSPTSSCLCLSRCLFLPLLLPLLLGTPRLQPWVSPRHSRQEAFASGVCLPVPTVPPHTITCEKPSK